MVNNEPITPASSHSTINATKADKFLTMVNNTLLKAINVLLSYGSAPGGKITM